MKWQLTVISALLASLATSPTHAWKIETHLWLANEILKEVSTDGAVRLPLGTYRIDQDLLRALSEVRGPNRPAFLIGVLGPDTYPDMIAGQMTTHPGLEVITKDYYNKEDNLRAIKLPATELLSKAQRNLNTEAEQAVMVAELIESQFAAAANQVTQKPASPPNTRVVPSPCLRRLHSGTPGHNSVETQPARLWQTDDWLCWVRARARAKRHDGPEASFAAGYFMHAAMDLWAHSYVNHYSGDVWTLSEEQEVEARHMALESVVSRLHASQHDLTQDDALTQLREQSPLPAGVFKEPSDGLTLLKAPVEFVRSTLILNPAVANQYAREELSLHLFGMYFYWSEVDTLAGKIEPLRSAVVSASTALTQGLAQAQAAYARAQTAYNTAVQSADTAYRAAQQAEADALKAQAHFTQVKNQALAQISQLSDALIATLPPDLRKQYGDAKSATERANKNLDDRRQDYDRLARERDEQQKNMQQELKNVQLYQRTLAGLDRVRDQTLTAINSGTALWRLGIERAVDAYIRAWEDTSKELIRPPGSRFSQGHDVTEPLKQWTLCWGPTFGLPVLTSIAPVCDQARSGYVTVNNNLTDLKLLAQSAAIPLHIRQAIEELDKTVSRTGGLVLVETAKLVSRALHVENGVLVGHARSFVNLRAKTPKPDEVNKEFADNTASLAANTPLANLRPKSLVKFPDVLTLLSQDFGIPKNVLLARLSANTGLQTPTSLNTPGRLPQQFQSTASANVEGLTLAQLSGFAALQNAYTMAKLVLLDGAQLNAIVRTRVAPKVNYPYHEQTPAGEILIGAVRSIDGDHQWQKFAPLFPRNPAISCQRLLSEEDRTLCSKPRQFGYDATDAERGGLKLWQDSSIRAEVFNRLFKGPLAPGLVSHLGPANLAVGIGLCPTNPFPATGSLPQTDPCRGMDLNNRLALPNMQTAAPAPAPTAPPQQAPGQFVPKADLPPPPPPTQQPPAQGQTTPPKGQTLPSGGLPKPMPRMGP